MQEFEPIVFLASLLSVLAVYVINRWLGGFSPAHIDCAAAALNRLKRDFPGFEEEEAVVGSDGKSAMLWASDGSIALVEAVGDRFVTRLLRPSEVTAISLTPSENGATLRLRLADFTNPAFRLVLPAGAGAGAWQARLAALQPAALATGAGD